MEDSHEMTANEKAMGGCTMVVAFLIFSAVVVYSDVEFIQIMWSSFPSGFLQFGAFIGAVATGASLIVLFLGKSYWFRPGPQLLMAWGFTGIELLVSILNVILSYQLSHHSVDAFMSMWQYGVSATPFPAAIGWILISYLDRSTVVRHVHLEMADDKAIAEVKYQRAIHKARMKLKMSHLDQVTEYVGQYVASAEVQAQYREHAQRFAADVLTEITGINARVVSHNVDGTLAKSYLAQEAALPAPKQQDVAVQPQSPTPKPPMAVHIPIVVDDEDEDVKKKLTMPVMPKMKAMWKTIRQSLKF